MTLKQRGNIKVLVLPKDANPYQEQLYGSMPKNITIRYFEKNNSEQLINFISYTKQLVIRRLEGFEILHLHWLYSFALSSPKPFQDWLLKLFAGIFVVFFFVFARVLGYKLVWTIHNIVPHEQVTPDDVLLTKLLYSLSNKTIALSQETLNQLKEIGITPSKTTIIPLGNYIGMYPNTISKENSREQLKIGNKKYVFLFFGLLREYKGIDLLLEAFAHLYKDNATTELVITGECFDPHIQKELTSYKDKLGDSLKLFIKHIQDTDVQTYFNAANIVILPFKKITNSSSVLLAFSFGKTAIYPLLGNLKELPTDVGFAYDPLSKDSLLEKMKYVVDNKEKVEISQEMALAYAKTLSWENIAVQTVEIYKEF